MTTKTSSKSKNKKPLETTLGKAPVNTGDDPIDLSHLRKPIDTSIFGLRQVLQLYETATDEVRRYVTYECDIMYECRMCRTIFRSLANFILHKRNYCRETYNPNDHTNCRNNCQESELRVNQEEEDFPVSTTLIEPISGGSSPIPTKCDSIESREEFQPTNTNSNSSETKENKKNLTYILRRLQGRQQSTLITEQCLSEDISNESKSSEKEEVKKDVALEKITEATSGVFQTMFRNMINEYKGDMMKTQVMEIHNILENNEAILGSDGKIVASETEKSAHFMCTVCNQKFSTKKTLTYHIKYKHNNTRLVYRCPECNDIFANAWSVFRHLYKIHRKTTAQVKKLRNQIHANIIRKDQQSIMKNGNTIKMDSEETSDMQEKANLENQQWMDDLEGDNDLQRCGGCGRKFERKAALHSHSQFCSKRIAICNSLKENSAKRTQTDKTKTSKSISNTNVENVVKGSRRRKQLISQKMCRIDYVKDNEISLENTAGNSKGYKCDHDTKAQIILGATQNASETQTDVIELHDDCIDSENEELVLIQNPNEIEEEDKIQDVGFKTGIATVFIVEEPRSCSRSESRSSDGDDVIYVDTIKLSPPLEQSQNFVEAVNDSNEDLKIKVSPNIIKNSIITRSMKNARKSPIRDNLDNNFAVESSDICVPFKPDVVDNLEHTENEKCCKNTSKEFCNNNGNKLEQSNCKANNKRKGIHSQLGNSKRKKDEVVPKTVQVENCLINTPKVTLETKSLKFIDKEKHTCLPCNKSFKSNKSLMKHMAAHFNWYRYQCRNCSFVSYSRSKCDHHVEIKHAIHDEEGLNNTVLHIPNWKTVDKCTEFTERCKKSKLKAVAINIQELNRNVSEEKLSELNNTCEHMKEVQKDESTVTQNLNSQGVLGGETSPKREAVTNGVPPPQQDVQDPSLRKMIMEVIFGNPNSSTEDIHSEEIPEPEEEKRDLEEEKGKLEEAKCGLEEDKRELEEEKPELQEEKRENLEDKRELEIEKDSERNWEKPDLNVCTIEDAAEGFLGFRNCTEVENQFKLDNPAISGVELRENLRPVRNRVPTVQKDFLYDMAQILKPKVAKDKEAGGTSSHKELDSSKKEKQKSVKMCTKETKPKNTNQLCTLNTKKLLINKSVEHVIQEPCTDLVQDINMNSKDLKKHVTGDCD